MLRARLLLRLPAGSLTLCVVDAVAEVVEHGLLAVRVVAPIGYIRK
jgi:hypothetical protein